jgi:hypothetical protein
VTQKKKLVCKNKFQKQNQPPWGEKNTLIRENQQKIKDTKRPEKK